MLQQLAANTGAKHWVVASMLFFVGVWCVIAFNVWRARPEKMKAQAQLPFSDEGDGEPPAQGSPRA